MEKLVHKKANLSCENVGETPACCKAVQYTAVTRNQTFGNSQGKLLLMAIGNHFARHRIYAENPDKNH